MSARHHNTQNERSGLGDRFQIVNGHHRVEAARREKLETVPALPFVVALPPYANTE
jgi:hypothetical protein